MIFQPAEESKQNEINYGAVQMILEGSIDNVNEVYGYHNSYAAPLGTMFYKRGCLGAGSADVVITVKST